MSSPLAYYNEFDPKAAAWLRELIKEGLIPPGDVDERSITEVLPADLAGYRQCHFFAGIAGWPYALRLANWPEDRQVWTGSCPCFPAGTLIQCEDGLRPIEAVRPGDMALTHRGRWRRVLKAGSEPGRPIVVVKGQGHWGLRCTPNHPILTKEGEFVPASEMAGRRWAIAGWSPYAPIPSIPEERKGFMLRGGRYRVTGWKDGKTVYLGTCGTEEEARAIRREALDAGRIAVRGADGADPSSLGFAYFLGRWVGDGWVTGDTVCVCDSFDKREEVEAAFRDAGLRCTTSMERTSVRCHCGSKALSSWLNENFGRGAVGKRLPAWLHGQTEGYRAEFLRGWFEADGSAEGVVACINTASRALAVGLTTLLVGLGYAPTVGRVEPRNEEGVTVIEGRAVHERGYWRVRWTATPRSFLLVGGAGYGLVRSVKEDGYATVYNLEVEEDHTYVAEGIVVHNCQPFSTAGLKKGESDPRHLWPEFHRLIRECMPPVVFGEQVASADGLRWLDSVLADLEASGYAGGAADLCAAGVGAPHIRQRLFWCGWRLHR